MSGLERNIRLDINNNENIEDIKNNNKGLSKETISCCINEYNNEMNTDRITSCACCGEANYDLEAKFLDVKTLSLLKCTQEKLVEINSKGNFKSLYNVHEHEGEYYHLHSHMINDEKAPICKSCQESLSKGMTCKIIVLYYYSIVLMIIMYFLNIHRDYTEV
jgi:hypothetical protein